MSTVATLSVGPGQQERFTVRVIDGVTHLCIEHFHPHVGDVSLGEGQTIELVVETVPSSRAAVRVIRHENPSPGPGEKVN